MIKYITDPCPLLRVKLYHLLKQIPCLPRDLIRVRHLSLYDQRPQFLQRPSLEWQEPIQQPIQHNPQRPDIRRKLLVPIPYKYLRSNVLRGPTDLIHDLTLKIQLLGHPKVTYLQIPLLVHQHVLQLDVPMHDPLGMHVAEGI